MIQPPGLTSAEIKALLVDLCRGPYIARPSVQILDLDHNLLDDVSDRILDGQVDWKLGQVGSRGGAVSASSAALTLADPRRSVAFDRATATKGAVFYDQMISAGMIVHGPSLGRAVRIPCFTGPVTKVVRSEGQVSVNCEGKERLATGMVGRPVQYDATTDKVAAIRDLLIRAGETTARIKTPGVLSALPDDYVLVDSDTAWRAVQTLVASLNRQCFYDARGVFRMRRAPGDPSWSVTDGDGGTLLTVPEVTYDGYEGYNGVRVTGPTRTGRRITVTVWLPPSHPLSPSARARNGVPFKRYLVIEQPLLRTVKGAERIALSHLRRMSREYVGVTANVMPNWLLEPGDVVAWRTKELGYLEQTLTEFSIPLVPGAPMTLGANRPIPRPRPSRASGSITSSTTKTPRRPRVTSNPRRAA